MSDDVKLIFTGDSATAEKALANLERKYDALENRLKHVSRTTRKGAQEATSEFDALRRVLTSGTGIAASFGVSAAGAFRIATAEMVKLTKEADVALMKMDGIQKSWRVTSGLRGLESDAAQKSIERIANQNAVATDQAFAAATQLVSSGVSPNQASGGALDAFLKTQSAMSVGGKDVDQAGLANAFAGYLTSQNMNLDDQSFKRLGKAMSGVRAGNFELEDLKSLAKEGATLTPISIEEQLSAATVLKNAGMENPGVALRNLVLNLQTAGSEEGKIATLNRMGLKPSDIDLIGENLDTALATVQTGMQRLPIEERAIAQKKLFEREGIATLGLLSTADNRNLMKEYANLARTGEGFDAAVAEMQSGPGAARVRLENRREQRMAGMGLDVEGRSLAAGEAYAARGMLPLQAELQRGAFEAGANSTGTLIGGRIAEAMMSMAPAVLSMIPVAGAGGAAGSTVMSQVLGRQAVSAGQAMSEADRAYIEAQKANTEALNKNTAAAERAAKQPMIDRNAQVE